MQEAIPQHWKKVVASQMLPHDLRFDNMVIPKGDKTIDLSKATFRSIYDNLIFTKILEPVTKEKICKAMVNDFTFKDACNHMNQIKMDMHMRQFQYEILHNILSVNQLLYIWRVSSTDIYSYCSVEKNR